MKYTIGLLSALIILSLCTSCNLKKDSYQLGQIITPHGEMLFWLFDETPNHKASFIELAKEGYWDSLSFNRVIEGFVIQGGCPDTPEGFTDPDYLIDAEFHEEFSHVYGAVGAGRDNNPEKHTATCQFYIVHRKEGIPRLDGDYTIFGQVIDGLDVLDMIASLPTNSLDVPLKPVTMEVNIIRLTKKKLERRGIETEALFSE